MLEYGPTDDLGDESHFDRPRKRREGGFDSSFLRESLSALPTRGPVVLSATNTVTDAIRAMQREHYGCVVVTSDGTAGGKLTGIFTERDVLLRIVDRGRNPATLRLGEMMTPDPEALSMNSSVASLLNRMSIDGFRHLPVVDEEHRPVFVVCLRDVLEFLVNVFPREVLHLPDKYASPTHREREGA